MATNWKVFAFVALLGACGSAAESPCETDTSCPRGQRCRLNGSYGYCSGKCDPRLCSRGETCDGVTRRCVLAACSLTCDGVTEFCDTAVPRCYPLDGTCASDEDCPYLSGVPGELGTQQCLTRVCRLLPEVSVRQIPELESAKQIPLDAPATGTYWGSSDELQVAWTPQVVDTFFLLLKAVPASLAGLSREAVWGAVVPQGRNPSAVWGSGVGISDGIWGSPLPSLDGTYLILAEGLVNGKLVSVSPPRTVRIGSEWPKDGDPCAKDLDCYEPLRAHVCLRGSCATACASNVDCRIYDSAASCGAPTAGIRVCAH
jgi:hypothetical protein